MSGTSMDGIDVALLETDGEIAVETGPTHSLSYSPEIRHAISASLKDATSIARRSERPGLCADVETLITDLHIRAVDEFLANNRMNSSDIDLIGFHGQTVLHRPEKALTVQLGKGERLAKETGIDTVFDFRANDMTKGGQGAPLVPVYHQALAGMIEAEKPVAFVNIGGIANISYVSDKDELIAFDTGPGNALIDQWLQSSAGIPFDAGGAIASEGAINERVLAEYLNAAYFEKKVPKSLDRGDFAPLPEGSMETSDGARTLARLTAETIFRAVDHLPEKPKSWIICGGGRLNETIMADLCELAIAIDAKVLPSEAVNLDGDMLEAQAFAYLAVRSAKGLPLTFPGTTGCSKPATGGVLSLGR